MIIVPKDSFHPSVHRRESELTFNRKLVLILLSILSTSLLDCRSSANKNDAKGPDQVSRQTIRLAAAAVQGDINEMEAAIKAGAAVNGNDVVGPPLVAAASRGNREAVKLLLDKGANVDARDNQGMTALMMAVAISGSAETVQYLLARGANPNASTTIGIGTSKVTALSLARSKNNETLIKLLRDAGAKE